MATPRPSKREELEGWWALTARVAAFIFGSYLLYQEQQPPPGTEWAIVAAAIGCMGPTVASAVATVLEAARGTSKEPPP